TGPAARRAGRTGRTRALTPRRDGVRYPPMSETAETLRRLHIEGPMLVLPNAWDAGSARIFVEAGFPALATTSAGIAFSLGYPDGERISRDEMLAAVSRITRRIAVPITADLEAGYGREPVAVAETVRRAIDAGVVGMNLEDRIEEKHLIDFTLAVERVRAARKAADATGVRLVLNARTDAFEAPDIPREKRLEEAVRRGNAFREAGADSVFVPFVGDRDTIEQLVQQIRAPVNILGTPNAPTLKELAALGVRRVTFGSAPMRATLGLVRRMAREWREKGTYGTLEAYGIPFSELKEVFGNRNPVRLECPVGPFLPPLPCHPAHQAECRAHRRRAKGHAPHPEGRQLFEGRSVGCAQDVDRRADLLNELLDRIPVPDERHEHRIGARLAERVPASHGLDQAPVSGSIR